MPSPHPHSAAYANRYDQPWIKLLAAEQSGLELDPAAERALLLRRACINISRLVEQALNAARQPDESSPSLDAVDELRRSHTALAALGIEVQPRHEDDATRAAFNNTSTLSGAEDIAERWMTLETFTLSAIRLWQPHRSPVHLERADELHVLAWSTHEFLGGSQETAQAMPAAGAA